MKTLVLFYSMYGHNWKMAEAAAEGAREIPGNEVLVKRVPETLPSEVLEKMHALDAAKRFADIPVATTDDLLAKDLIIFAVPTRFGIMAAQMKTFLDATGGIWASGGLVGKVGTVLTSSATQHGGQESTILSFHTLLLHQGMVIVGLPYAFTGQTGVDEIKGGSPYGASTIAGGDGMRQPSATELSAARYQGKHAAEIAEKISRK